jgi:hypothetical protein
MEGKEMLGVIGFGLLGMRQADVSEHDEERERALLQGA